LAEAGIICADISQVSYLNQRLGLFVLISL